MMENAAPSGLQVEMKPLIQKEKGSPPPAGSNCSARREAAPEESAPSPVRSGGRFRAPPRRELKRSPESKKKDAATKDPGAKMLPHHPTPPKPEQCGAPQRHTAIPTRNPTTQHRSATPNHTAPHSHTAPPRHPAIPPRD